MSEPRTRPYAETKPVEMFPGVVRRTFVSGAHVTLVEVTLSPGAEVPEHTHPHEQAGTVDSGRLHIRIGTHERELAPGDSYLIPGGMPHYVRAVDAARLVEVFSPPREEFAAD